jgi:hypothetical protein
MDGRKKLLGGQLFAAAAMLGGAAGVSSDAQAICSCQKPSLTRAFATQDFYYFGTSNYQALLTTDEQYGFQSTRAPAVWIQYISAGQGTLTTQVCRWGFSQSIIACGPTSSNSAVAGTPVTKQVLTSGLYAPGNSVWDRYYIHVIGINQSDVWRLKGGAVVPVDWA